MQTSVMLCNEQNFVQIDKQKTNLTANGEPNGNGTPRDEKGRIRCHIAASHAW